MYYVLFLYITHFYYILICWIKLVIKYVMKPTLNKE